MIAMSLHNQVGWFVKGQWEGASVSASGAKGEMFPEGAWICPSPAPATGPAGITVTISVPQLPTPPRPTSPGHTEPTCPNMNLHLAKVFQFKIARYFLYAWDMQAGSPQTGIPLEGTLSHCIHPDISLPQTYSCEPAPRQSCAHFPQWGQALLVILKPAVFRGPLNNGEQLNTHNPGSSEETRNMRRTRPWPA